MSNVISKIYLNKPNADDKKQIRKDMLAIRKLYRKSSIIPEDTGNLKYHMTSFSTTQYGYKIVVDKASGLKRNKAGAEWYGYFLETGSAPHDIPNSFGKGMNYGFGKDVGRDFWHPGSKKWKGWFSRNLPLLVSSYYKSFTISNKNLQSEESTEEYYSYNFGD